MFKYILNTNVDLLLISSLIMKHGYIFMSQCKSLKTRYGLPNTWKKKQKKNQTCIANRIMSARKAMHVIFYHDVQIAVPKRTIYQWQVLQVDILNILKETLQQTKASDGSVWCPTVTWKCYLQHAVIVCDFKSRLKSSPSVLTKPDWKTPCLKKMSDL